MKQKREGQAAGHGLGPIMPKSPSWPPPPSPSSVFLGGVHRSQIETLRVLKVTNAKLGDHAKALKKDRDEKREVIQRNVQVIRDLETRNMQLERVVSGSLLGRVMAAFGLRRKSGRG